ncbi:hypothetical protein RFI_05269 [Reticulomyxa filosa]|uniref:Actin n=1 Tax=Reticulomyxa filosa TaxID=46433 RepID=X6P2R1_RETFI|nr:hypothetical protein RFI_05269 [Reticulomyxa filosa]|eukprot:ETO31847.1 hypothetical protein RFI_05269 [Reticulomyxa filosa]
MWSIFGKREKKSEVKESNTSEVKDSDASEDKGSKVAKDKEPKVSEDKEAETKNEEMPSYVIDNGSGTIKAGVGGDDAPKAIFRPVVGQPRHGIQKYASNSRFFVGDDVHGNSDIFLLRYPMERGLMINWDDMEKIWHRTFYKFTYCQQDIITIN